MWCFECLYYCDCLHVVCFVAAHDEDVGKDRHDFIKLSAGDTSAPEDLSDVVTTGEEGRNEEEQTEFVGA